MLPLTSSRKYYLFYFKKCMILLNNWLSILVDVCEFVVFSGLRINAFGIRWMIFCRFSTLFRPLLIPTLKNCDISWEILLSFSSVGNIYRIFSRRGSRRTTPICSAWSLYLFTVLQLQYFLDDMLLLFLKVFSHILLMWRDLIFGDVLTYPWGIDAVMEGVIFSLF